MEAAWLVSGSRTDDQMRVMQLVLLQLCVVIPGTSSLVLSLSVDCKFWKVNIVLMYLDIT